MQRISVICNTDGGAETQSLSLQALVLLQVLGCYGLGVISPRIG